MLKIGTNSKVYGDVTINLPTSLSEIDSDYINEVTKHITVADDYSLIALIKKVKLSEVIGSIKQKDSNRLTAVIPVFVKCGKTTNDYINTLSCNDKIIIAASDIEIGHHVVSSTNIISIDNFMAYAVEDEKVRKSAFALTTPCYFLSFKLVPNCSIHGSYKSVETNKNIISRFVTYGTLDGSGV